MRKKKSPISCSKKNCADRPIVLTEKDLGKATLRITFKLIYVLIIFIILSLIIRDRDILRIFAVGSLILGICIIVLLVFYLLSSNMHNKDNNILTINSEGIKIFDKNLVPWYKIERVRITEEWTTIFRKDKYLLVEETNKNPKKLEIGSYVSGHLLNLYKLRDTIIYFSGDKEKISIDRHFWW